MTQPVAEYAPHNLLQDDPSINLIGFLTSAVHDEEPPYTLEQILETLETSDLACHLDPLNSLSILLPCSNPTVGALLDLVSSKCSAKEILIASEESLERLHRAALLAEAEDEQNENGSSKDLAIGAQVLRLVKLFSVIVKVPFRRKSAAETIKSFLPELQSTIRITSGSFSKLSGRETIFHSARLVDRILEWTKTKDEVTKEEINACNDILVPFIESVVDSLTHCIRASLAKRAFKQCFPRLGLRENLESGWEQNAEALTAAISSHDRAGGSTRAIVPSRSSLIFSAHRQFVSPNPTYSENSFSIHLPIIIASIQTNTLLDESLSFLLLHLFQTQKLGRELDPEIAIPLCTILPGLASAHPDAFIRHCTFRVLGLVLTVAPVPLKMQILQDLASDKSMPQMRVAVVGLIKDAVLEALAKPVSSQSTTNPLASPRFLQTFGSILFASDPPDMFTDSKKVPTVKEIEESTELIRLAECLSLYFVVEMRDVKNRTGIRDRDNQANIERTLLAPMRAALPRWIEAIELEEKKSSGSIAANNATLAHLHSHAVMPLVSLKMGLERIDDRKNSM